MNQYRAADKTYHRENFGVLEIDWEARKIAVEIRDIQGAAQISYSIALRELQ